MAQKLGTLLRLLIIIRIPRMQFANSKIVQDAHVYGIQCVHITLSERVYFVFSSLEDVTNELNSFMDLFHHLALLFSESDKSPPLLDVDCKGSILGETMHGLQPFNHS